MKKTVIFSFLILLISLGFVLAQESSGGGSGGASAPNSSGGGSGAGVVYCEDYPSSANCVCREGVKTEKTCNESVDSGCSAIVSYECVVASSGGGGGSGVSAPSAGGGGEGSSSPTLYTKTCTYTWNSSSHLRERIEIWAIITDQIGNKASNSINPLVVESNPWISKTESSPMSGKSLEIKIQEPKEGEIIAGPVEIKVYAQGPYELNEMSLSLGDGFEGAFPISDENCIAASASGGGGSTASSSGGGGGSTSKCEKYYTCEDGTEVQYCSIHKFYDEDGEVNGVGCGCKYPRDLCPQETEPTPEDEQIPEPEEQEEEPVPLEESSSSGSGEGSNETPVICNGCILEDKCAPVGYRVEGKYCNLDSEFVNYLKEGKKCENNFECSSNLCIDSECVSGGLFTRFLNWFRKAFGRE